jgi:predicted nucleic acid-binding protein
VRVLFDTSVLIAALLGTHPEHLRALPWLQRAKLGADAGVVAAHSVAELYAVLTRLPIRPRISPSLARRLIEQDVLSVCEVVALTEAEYAAMIPDLEANGVVGGATYDALILRAAAKAGVAQVLTFNTKEFRRVNPAMAGLIMEP